MIDLSTLHEGHRDRLKNQFLNSGLSSFEPHKIIELVLFFAIPRRDTNETAHLLLNAFGSLSGVFDADYEDLIQVPGVGKSGALLIKLLAETAGELAKDRQSHVNKLSTMQDAMEYAEALYSGQTKETVVMICLDNRGKILQCSQIAQGSLEQVSLIPRDVVKIALRVGATSVILAHNHPRGLNLPSSKDRYATDILCSALKAVGIKLQDHIIVNTDGPYSMLASGLYKPE